MDTRSLLAAFDRDQRREITYPGTRREAFPHLVRFVRPPSSTSFILFTDLDESSADRVIDEQVAYFNRLRRPFNWKVFAHDHPADLVPRLLERGFEADDEQAVMVLETAVVPPSLLAAPQFPVTRLTDRAQLSDVAAVLGFSPDCGVGHRCRPIGEGACTRPFLPRECRKRANGAWAVWSSMPGQ